MPLQETQRERLVHWQAVLKTRQQISTLSNQLTAYSELNHTAFYKILKKYDKVNGTSEMATRLASMENEPFLQHTSQATLKALANK